MVWVLSTDILCYYLDDFLLCPQESSILSVYSGARSTPTAEMYIIIGYRTRGAHFVHIRIGRALLFSMLWTLLLYLVCHVVPQ